MHTARVCAFAMVVSFCAVTARAQATNLALNRPAFASSVYSTLAPSLAVDGAGSTRWSSNFSDNEWWYADLGATYTLSKVVINWEAAYAKTYDLQVSQDAVTWTTFFSGTNTFPANAGRDRRRVTTPGTGRYVESAERLARSPGADMRGLCAKCENVDARRARESPAVKAWAGTFRRRVDRATLAPLSAAAGVDRRSACGDKPGLVSDVAFETFRVTTAAGSVS